MGHSYLDNKKIMSAYLAKQITALEKEKLLKQLNKFDKTRKSLNTSSGNLTV